MVRVSRTLGLPGEHHWKRLCDRAGWRESGAYCYECLLVYRVAEPSVGRQRSEARRSRPMVLRDYATFSRETGGEKEREMGERAGSNDSSPVPQSEGSRLLRRASSRMTAARPLET